MRYHGCPARVHSPQAPGQNPSIIFSFPRFFADICRREPSPDVGGRWAVSSPTTNDHQNALSSFTLPQLRSVAYFLVNPRPIFLLIFAFSSPFCGKSRFYSDRRKPAASFASLERVKMRGTVYNAGLRLLAGEF